MIILREEDVNYWVIVVYENYLIKITTGAGHFHVNFTYFNIFIESVPPPENNIEKMSIKCVKFEATRAAAA